MSKKCELTGKIPLKGHNVSHANNKTKRRFLPNLQNISFLSEKLGKNIQLKVAVSTTTKEREIVNSIHLKMD